MRGFNKYQVIRNKDKIIFLDKSDIEIRKEILEYKFNGESRIKIEDDFIQIDEDFRVMLSSGQARYKPNDSYRYLCVQPTDKISDIEVNTPLGIMYLDPTGVLVYAKVLFLLNIEINAIGDNAIIRQFRGNRYRKYLKELR